VQNIYNGGMGTSQLHVLRGSSAIRQIQQIQLLLRIGTVSGQLTQQNLFREMAEIPQRERP